MERITVIIQLHLTIIYILFVTMPVTLKYLKAFKLKGLTAFYCNNIIWHRYANAY